MTEQTQEEMMRDYDRSIYRSQLVSLFWSVILDRKKSGFTFQKLADKLSAYRKKRVDKAQVSRWFSGLPNWEANTAADVASALDVDLQIVARDRLTGKIYTASGSYSGTARTETNITMAHRGASGTQATGRRQSDGVTISRAET